MTILLFVLGFFLGAGAIVFAIQNTQVVALTFMGWQFESSLALLVIVVLGVGMLVSMLAFLPYAISGTFKIMRLKSENKKLVQELEAHEQAVLMAKASLAPETPSY
jgi:putative membrane protein